MGIFGKRKGAYIKTKVFLGMALIVCLLAPHAQADDKKMTSGKNVKGERLNNNQRSLPKVEQPRGPKKGSDSPGRNKHFSGHQDGYRPVDMGGGQKKGPVEHGQTPDRPQGGPDWLKDKNKKNKKGGVDQFGRDAQLTKLADPTGGFKEFSGKNTGRGNNLSDEPIGANGLIGGSSTPAFPTTTVSRGYGKNATSKQSEQGLFANTQITESNPASGAPVSAPVPYPKTTDPGFAAYDAVYSPPSAKLSTTVAPSNGEQAGTSTGVASGTVMGNDQSKSDNSMRINGMTGQTPKQTLKSIILTAGTPNPDGSDENHVPDSVKNLSNFGQKDPKDVEDERKRQTSLPGEGANHGGLRREDIQVTPQDMLAKRTDNRTRPADGDGSTTNVGAGTDPDVDIDPLTGLPKKRKTHGGGGDPPPGQNE